MYLHFCVYIHRKMKIYTWIPDSWLNSRHKCRSCKRSTFVQRDLHLKKRPTFVADFTGKCVPEHFDKKSSTYWIPLRIIICIVVYIYVYIHIYICICIYINMFIYMYIYIYIYVYIDIYICLYIYIHMCLYMCKYKCI